MNPHAVEGLLQFGMKFHERRHHLCDLLPRSERIAQLRRLSRISGVLNV
jgi:hypothetical protein